MQTRTPHPSSPQTTKNPHPKSCRQIISIIEIPDISAIISTQDTKNIQNNSTVEYAIRTSPVALTFYRETRATDAGKDANLYTSTCVYPMVTIEENENAANSNVISFLVTTQFYAGKIEFTVPYADLMELGLKEQYNYEGIKTIRLQTEEVCSLDLNGDGQKEDSVVPYTFLYRYAKNGSLIYPGKLEGRVTDPTKLLTEDAHHEQILSFSQ